MEPVQEPHIDADRPRPTPSEPHEQSEQAQQDQGQDGPPPKVWGPRTCRICLEVVHPTFPQTIRTALGIGGGAMPKPDYLSEDRELGRLMSPCRCKGTQKYVHEGCLQSWRTVQPLEETNYWECPTCHFRYKLSRLSIAHWLNSEYSQLALTFLILAISIFALGFVADPIINLWVDPYAALTGTLFDDEIVETVLQDEGDGGWTEHFGKGFLSLGLIGLAKTLMAASPWTWWNIRSSGMLGGGRRRDGRTGMQNVSWVLVAVGAATFMYTVWKLVRLLSKKALGFARDTVVDVGEGDDEDASHEHKD